MEFSDYIVYVDESGSADLSHVDPQYPLLVLSCCLIRIEHYVHRIVPALQEIKFRFCGHDQLIFHEIDIRKRRKGFEFLQNSTLQLDFINCLTEMVTSSEFEIISAVVNKEQLKSRYASPHDPYDLALQFCIENLASRLIHLNQRHRRIFLIFEERGTKEDQRLELAFRRIVDGIGPLPNWNASRLRYFDWQMKFVSKKANSSGLQLADLTARPIGLSVLRPDQANRAYDNFRAKICCKKQFP